MPYWVCSVRTSDISGKRGKCGVALTQHQLQAATGKTYCWKWPISLSTRFSYLHIFPKIEAEPIQKLPWIIRPNIVFWVLAIFAQLQRVVCFLHTLRPWLSCCCNMGFTALSYETGKRGWAVTQGSTINAVKHMLGSMNEGITKFDSVSWLAQRLLCRSDGEKRTRAIRCCTTAEGLEGVKADGTEQMSRKGR